MGKSLIIVESPAKARTISKYLGKDYEVRASVGHVKDLPKNDIGVDTQKDFEPRYEVIRGKGKVIQEIRKASRAADRVFLAPDPDREGEAIAWHIAEEIRTANGNITRVLFHEITKGAILEALKNPRELDRDKFESQQARRILDRLVGYEVSPVLWDKVRRGLSAGRVQSVAVRLVVEREREIAAFVPEEYWTVEADVEGPVPPPFLAKLAEKGGQKFRPANQAEATAAVQTIRSSDLVVRTVERKETKRAAPPPFITSKLQQEAARQLRMTAKRTMAVAQRLYEGVELGAEGAVGLITYMRTDSTRLSEQAVTAAREFILSNYGPEYLPQSANLYKSKKGAQDAHEAIRPTAMEYPPERIKPFLERDEYRLYSLIWNRFVACQMTPARYDKTTVDIAAGEYTLRANGSILTFPGYTKIYIDRREGSEGEDRDRMLPPIEEGQRVALRDLRHEQQFTQPPPRYSESGLIKELEEQGIGRPSTYASIISTIQDKEYVEKRQDARFWPTELGTIVTDLLVENFPQIFDVKFTAQMEDALDKVEEGETRWLDLLRGFYGPFSETLERARREMRDVKRQEIPTDIPCDRCGKHMVIKFGRNGSFLGCSGYPECRSTAEYIRTEDGKVRVKPQETTEERCPECSSALLVKQGKFGRFLACSNYPTCKFTKPVGTGARCPREGCAGELVEKRSKRGKVFYGCSNYPKCDYATWDKPLDEKCPDCGAPNLFEKRRRGGAVIVHCERCGHEKGGEGGGAAAPQQRRRARA